MKFFSSQQGFSLLELLIALIILSIGLLGFAQAEISALRDSQSAYFQSIANIQATAMAERMRACANQSSCISKAKAEWQAENKLLLPQAESLVAGCRPNCEITIKWHTVAHDNSVNLKTRS